MSVSTTYVIFCFDIHNFLNATRDKLNKLYLVLILFEHLLRLLFEHFMDHLTFQLLLELLCFFDVPD